MLQNRKNLYIYYNYIIIVIGGEKTKNEQKNCSSNVNRDDNIRCNK